VRRRHGGPGGHGPAIGLGPGPDPRDDLFRDAFQRLEHADPVQGRRLELGEAPLGVQVAVQLFDRQRVADVALVVLEHQRHVGARGQAQLAQVLRHVVERLEVRVEHGGLRVGHEHDAVDALQHQLAGGVVEDLAGHRVELEPHLHPADHADVERQQVEEEGAVGLGLQADHLAARARCCLLVDELEVGGLPTQARTVVHDLGRHLHRGVVQEDHGGASITSPPPPAGPG
jgi:hypothetical protein